MHHILLLFNILQLKCTLFSVSPMLGLSYRITFDLGLPAGNNCLVDYIPIIRKMCLLSRCSIIAQ